MSVLSWIIQYKSIIIFYGVIIVLLLLNKKKIQTQAKIIFLYRMKWGLQWMDKYAKKFREWIILLGYVGTGLGFIGMVVISYVLVKNLYDLIVNPATTPGVSLVLPGINIPGLGILPFWYWIGAIFIIALVHEFAHGIVARAHNVPVKNTGIVLLGPILGAFVEPNEKVMRKQKDITQYSILAAGSFSNILLAALAGILLNFVFMPIQAEMVEPAGFTFDAYFEGDFPFEQAGVPLGTVITGIDGQKTQSFTEFHDKLTCKNPGDKISLVTEEKPYAITLAENPDNPGKGFLGISQIRNEVQVKEKYQVGMANVAYLAVDGTSKFLRWLFLLSFGIGLFNLLPLPIVDGGRMAQVFLHRWKGREKGEKRYRQISLFLLLVLVISLLFPLLIKIF